MLQIGEGCGGRHLWYMQAETVGMGSQAAVAPIPDLLLPVWVALTVLLNLLNPQFLKWQVIIITTSHVSVWIKYFRTYRIPSICSINASKYYCVHPTNEDGMYDGQGLALSPWGI